MLCKDNSITNYSRALLVPQYLKFLRQTLCLSEKKTNTFKATLQVNTK